MNRRMLVFCAALGLNLCGANAAGDVLPVFKDSFEEKTLSVACPPSLTGPVLDRYQISALPNVTIDAEEWRMAKRPVTSSSELITTGNQTEFFADAIGEYQLTYRAIAKEEFSACSTIMDLATNDTLVVELAWTGETADLDLFLHRAPVDTFLYWDEATTENVDLCYWRTCKTCIASYTDADYEQQCRTALEGVDSNPVLVWNPAENTANPRLDLDDIEGHGPEVINVRSPDPGIYRVAAHLWDLDGDIATRAQVRVLCRGDVIYTSQAVTLEEHGLTTDPTANDVWEVGDLVITEEAGQLNCSFQQFGNDECHRICPLDDANSSGCPIAACEL